MIQVSFPPPDGFAPSCTAVPDPLPSPAVSSSGGRSFVVAGATPLDDPRATGSRSTT